MARTRLIASLGLDRVLEHMAIVARRSGRTPVAPLVGRDHDSLAELGGHGAQGPRALGTGQRRILEHVLMTSTVKQLKMPR